MSEETGIEIIEKEENEQEETDLDLSELDSNELELVKKHGLTKEAKEEDKELKNDDTKEEAEEDDEINTDPDNFEEMDKVIEKDEKKFHQKYTPNQKALYFKQKAFKKKYQERDAYAKELEQKLAEYKDAGDSKEKLDQIAKLLKENTEDLTVEQLQSIISKQAEKKDDEPVNTEKSKEKYNNKVEFVRNIGLSKYENFEKLAQLADEVVREDKSGIYLEKIARAFEDDSVEESDIVDSIVKLAKLNEKYEETVGKKPKKDLDEEKEDRVIKNSKKKISSASVGGSSARSIVNFEDLTLQQLANLPTEQYAKVPQEIRDKLLKQA